MPTIDFPSSKLILQKVEEASGLLGWDSDLLLEKAGWTKKVQGELAQGGPVPSMPRLKALAEASGLPLEFFISNYRVPITPARFRAGASEVDVKEGTDSSYYQRKTILRLASLADLLASIIPREDVRPFRDLRERCVAKGANPARLLLQALNLRPHAYPLGPKLLEALSSLGVQVLFSGLYHEAKVVGLSWWQRGFLPIIACSTAVSVKRSYFTVAHEVMHLLMDIGPDEDGGGFKCIPVPGEKGAKKDEERRADQAAAEFLMPDELIKEARAVVGEQGPVDAARQLANEWEVSGQAVAVRLVTWELATWPQIKVFFEPTDWAPPSTKPKKGFGTAERTQQVLRLLYESGVSAGYISWATGLPLDRVLVDLGRLRPQDLTTRGRG